MRRAFERLQRHAVDAAIVVLAVAVEVEVFVRSDVDHFAAVPLGLLTALPLLLRRRYPLLAPTIVCAALSLQTILDPDGLQRLVTPFFAALAAAAVFGANPSRRDAIVGAGIVAVTIGLVASTSDGGIGDWLWLYVFFTIFWAAGLALGTRTRQAAELRARVDDAEREREERTRVALEEERARIARELHDVVAHTVSAMIVQTGAVRRLLYGDQEQEREALVMVEEYGRQALAEMRRLTEIEGGAPTLAPQPTLDRVDALCDQVREAGLPVALKVEGTPVPLPPGVEVSAYRIVQEALADSLKKAGRAHAQVVVRYRGDELELEISDDGRGRNGDGLVGMRERVALYGGELESGPRNGGYAVRARLPLKESPE